MHLGRFGVSLSALGLGACSLLVGSDLTGGGDVAAPSDAAAEALPGTDAADAAVETGGPDTSTDAAPPSPCKTATHDFCADFDGPDLFAGWSNTTKDGALVASTSALSPPFALEARLPRHDTTFGRSQVLVSFPRAWTRTTVEFDLFLEPPAFEAADTDFGILCVNFFVGSTADGVCLGRSATQTQWTGFGASFRSGQWVHAKHVLDPFSRTASVLIDGINIAGDLNVPAAGAGPTSIVVELGVLGYNKPAPDVTMRFDNVTVDFD